MRSAQSGKPEVCAGACGPCWPAWKRAPSSSLDCLKENLRTAVAFMEADQAMNDKLAPAKTKFTKNGREIPPSSAPAKTPLVRGQGPLAVLVEGLEAVGAGVPAERPAYRPITPTTWTTSTPPSPARPALRKDPQCDLLELPLARPTSRHAREHTGRARLP